MVETRMVSQSVDETHRLAGRLARIVRPGDVLALEGDLGAGKTTFTQGFARALGVEGQVNSPTFTLIKEYEGRLPVYHMDLYRLDGPEEAWELGLEEYFDGDGVCIVEWPDRLGDTLPEDVIHLHFQIVSAEERRIRIKGNRGRGNERVKELTAE